MFASRYAERGETLLDILRRNANTLYGALPLQTLDRPK